MCLYITLTEVCSNAKAVNLVSLLIEAYNGVLIDVIAGYDL